MVGICLSTLTKWKRRPEFKERVAELTQVFADKVLKEGLARRELRVATLCRMHEKLEQIVAERAADTSLDGIPGARTGLVLRSIKLVGKQRIETFISDTKLVKELRGTSEQIARELGQWQERVEIEDTSLADIMAKARQRKPAEATPQPSL